MFTAQLNQAARHRNVYYDTIGGDPYGEIWLFTVTFVVAVEKGKGSWQERP